MFVVVMRPQGLSGTEKNVSKKVIDYWQEDTSKNVNKNQHLVEL
jgi:hypothetical protein